jgi:hypothetical protein
LTTATTNVPRIDYNPITGACNGLLVEQASTNLILQSNFGSNPNWYTPGSPTVTANAATSPDGTTNAVLWTRITTAASFIGHNIGSKAASALVYTFSVFVKASVGNYVALRTQGTYPARADVVFNLSSGTISTAAIATSTFTGASATIQALSNGWYRVSLTATSDTNTDIQGYISFNSGGGVIDATDSVSNSAGYLYGAQVEQLTFPTSYIATTAATATRSADVASIPIGTLFNPNAFTVYTENIMANITPIDYSRILVINNSSNPADGIRILTTPTSNPPVRLYGFIGSAGGFPESGNSVILYTANAIVEGALSVSSNNAYITWNGATPVANNTAFGTYTPSSFTTLWISAPTSITGANTYCGWARRIVLWTQALSNTELQTLTS